MVLLHVPSMTGITKRISDPYRFLLLLLTTGVDSSTRRLQFGSSDESLNERKRDVLYRKYT